MELTGTFLFQHGASYLVRRNPAGQTGIFSDPFLPGEVVIFYAQKYDPSMRLYICYFTAVGTDRLRRIELPEESIANRWEFFTGMA